jgi:hypothetical protein
VKSNPINELMIMKKEDTILIQRKIDGDLSGHEEGQFTQLIERSGKARNLYQKLLLLNHSLNANANDIEPIDLSEKIMRSVQPNRILHSDSRPSHSMRIGLSSNLLNVAAILLFGFFAGGLTAYLVMNNEGVLNRQAISGTLSKTPETGHIVYSDKGTQIIVHTIPAQQLSLSVISIETDEMIECRIFDNMKLLSSENIVQLSTGNEVEIALSGSQEIVCKCSGSAIFQIKTLKGSKLTLNFLRNKKEIANTMIN